jgi:hypothetical protein
MYYNEKTGNFALTQPNLTEIVIDEVTNEMTETIVGPDPDYVLIPDKPNEDYIFDGAQWVAKVPIVPTLAEAKSAKLKEVTSTYNASITALAGSIDKFELVSWTKQESEARAYVADNTVATPLLSGMVITRGLGETVADLANKIIAKADAYQTLYASILGTYQSKQRAIDAATTVDEVNAVS